MLLYNLLLFMSAVAAAPYFMIRILSTPKYRTGLAERFGLYSDEKLTRISDEPLIWIHAASVGEVKAAAPMASQFRQRLPGHRIIFSTLTLAGNRLCRDQIDADAVIFFPLDLPVVVNRALKAFSPKLLIVVETELWPNFLKAASARGIPAVLVNGRISDKSFPRYLRFRRFFRKTLRRFAALIMQDRIGRERVIELGADPAKVYVAGSLKHDSARDIRFDPAMADRIKRKMGFAPDSRVIVGGCTHPGEEEILVNIFIDLKEKMPDLQLVLAPRHLERIVEVENLLTGKGLSYCRYSRRSGSEAPRRQVVLIDVMGVLCEIYQAASVVFIGKSLTRRGGHNPIEPAAAARPIVFGPNMGNFAEVASALVDGDGALQVPDADELHSAIESLLTDAEQAGRLGKNARRTLDERTGAAERTIEIIQRLLES